MKVVIREEALDDLDGIFAWIAKDDPEAAADALQSLRERIARLETPGFAHMGRPGIVAGTRELIEPPYIIVYAAPQHLRQLVILAVFHARQDRT